MITIQQDNNIYQIVKIEEGIDHDTRIDLVWGKTDFRCVLSRKDGEKILSQCKVKRDDIWYDYIELSSHGTLMEETKWRNREGNDIYIELPRKLRKNLLRVCLKATEQKGTELPEI